MGIKCPYCRGSARAVDLKKSPHLIGPIDEEIEAYFEFACDECQNYFYVVERYRWDGEQKSIPFDRITFRK